MSNENCPACGEQVVDGRLNCTKCGAVYPDVDEKNLTWDPTEDKDKAEGTESDSFT